MREAMFYECRKEKKISCQLCPFECLIQNGHLGRCRQRQNIDGKLYSLSYKNIASWSIDPIEKKPLYHFAPGSSTFSFGTFGCNWQCQFCCNWEISSTAPRKMQEMSPAAIVKAAIEAKCQGISYTFTEPTIFFELSYETAKLAKRKGLYNTWVTNGWTNLKPIQTIAPYLDAVSVNLKGSAQKNFLAKFSQVPDNQPIFESLKEYHKHGVHLEVTDLLAPGGGDSLQDVENLVIWIFENLGADTPLHFLKFFPAYLSHSTRTTPTHILKQAYHLAKSEGLKYVYLGNLPTRENNTYCPECGALLIEREAIGMKKNLTHNGQCPKCSNRICLNGLNWIES